MLKKRVPLQVAPEFRERIIKIKHILAGRGTDISLRDITEQMIKFPAFEEIENELIKFTENLDINIRFDRRIR